MATTTQSGIQFTNIYKDGGIKHGDTLIQNTWKASSAYPSDDNFPLVNAVDIDWNGAKLGSTTINTTGDLLSYISSKVGSGSGSGNLASISVTFS